MNSMRTLLLLLAFLATCNLTTHVPHWHTNNDTRGNSSCAPRPDNAAPLSNLKKQGG